VGIDGFYVDLNITDATYNVQVNGFLFRLYAYGG